LGNENHKVYGENGIRGTTHRNFIKNMFLKKNMLKKEPNKNGIIVLLRHVKWLRNTLMAIVNMAFYLMCL
jgi:hypothetical protein